MSSESEAARNTEALQALAQRHEPDSQRAEPADPASPDLPLLPVTVLEPPPTAAERGEGRIARAELLEFLESGPHGILTAFEVDPVMQDNAFRGYRIVALDPTREVVTGSGLRVGDVVTTVNGHDVSRPETFMEAWSTLAEADHLNVDIVRRGDPRTLSWTIE